MVSSLESDPMVHDTGDARMYGGEPGPMKKGRNMRGNAAAGVAVLATLPWLMFSLIVCLFSFVYVEFAPVVWALVACCLGLAVLLAGLYFFSRRLAHLALGFLCVTGCTAGLLVGMIIHESYMGEHSRLERGARYHNVQPAELATSHADAVFVGFSVGSAIDTTHAVGFKISEETYCAAPILDGTEADNTVQYWAVGVGCCLERGDFECDDAKDPQARGGIVLSEDDEDMDHYKAAVAEVDETHGLESPKTALFLRWTTDPNKVINDLWSSGVKMIALSVGLYLVVSIVVAIALDHFVKLDRR